MCCEPLPFPFLRRCVAISVSLSPGAIFFPFHSRTFRYPRMQACRSFRIAVVVRLLASHLGEPGSISAGVAPGFSRVGIVLYDAAASAGFHGDLSFPPPFHLPVLFYTHLASPSSALETSMTAEPTPSSTRREMSAEPLSSLPELVCTGDFNGRIRQQPSGRSTPTPTRSNTGQKRNVSPVAPKSLLYLYVNRPWRNVVINSVEDDPSISTWQVAASQRGVSQTTMWNILHYRHHLQRVQGLLPKDFPPREQFLSLTMPPLRGAVSSTSTTPIYGPRGIPVVRWQRTISLNVWVGIIGDRLVGPVVLPQRLTGEAYLHYLPMTLLPPAGGGAFGVTETIYGPRLGTGAILICSVLHDGAPAHFLITVQRQLNTVFHGRWIGRGGQVAWPARSPDLNLVDFHL
ncbi:hypothetical protein PR048_008184 [Dryococelus australis]|uniref:Uncharacterized protein n=1 Tax=Dryococelus australis TaxID=614101 RepID=A0ABQ9HWD8_9NEOP|nr:hypothetical protein PR048_008184 [Dryococelus australis]